MRHPARRALNQLLDKHRRVIGGLSDVRLKEGGYTLKRFLIDIKDDRPQGRDFPGIFSSNMAKRAFKI
jgi:hypothetical protein